MIGNVGRAEATDILDCLPPLASGSANPERCALTPPDKKDLEVYDCQFVRRDGRALECLVFTGTHHSLKSFRYGIRYFAKADNAVLLEDGFDGSRSYSSGDFDGLIQPGETLVVLLAAPWLPAEVSPDQVFAVVEVKSVWQGHSWE